MNWLDKPDSKTRFFITESDVGIEGDDFVEFIHELLGFVLESILRSGDAIEFDILFVEINCDTGRIIVSPGTESNRVRGTLHGCAARLIKLQNFWYDLDESGVSGQEFQMDVQSEVRRIGLLFANGLQKRLSEFSAKSKTGSFKLVVFGSDPEKIILRKEISTN